jgi:hypothetical protein
MKLRRFRVALVMVAVGLGSACTRTRMTSSLSPEATGATYSRILVVFSVPDLRLREFVENQFASQSPSVFIPGHSILPPTREYSNEEILGRLSQEHVDALLLVRLSDAGTDTKPVQAARTTACSGGGGQGRGCFGGFITPSGGGTINQSWAFFDSSLMDMSTRIVVWTGSAESKGSQFSGSDDVLRSMALKTVERLREDGVVR